MTRKTCGICARVLDNPDDWLSLDCGGDCRGCMNVIENPEVWCYHRCYVCLTDCVIRNWQKPHFEEMGQTIRNNQGKLESLCVEVYSNSGMSTLMMNYANTQADLYLDHAYVDPPKKRWPKSNRLRQR
ncbi:hypothetical protein C8J25_101853 [Sphingomonas faeni]|uniref:Uncharacterized protein n=1 Tax=Sphingomonas faeni TaxID=185950 RepID=A0A2T5UCV4_9SPHN|nr:hypothetical protein [Sphingomonas faeni]PTW49345.1 hypothetical protein C8J25_101853 [Sphingomonas faeni]